MTPATVLLQRIIETGSISAAEQEWVVSALRAWVASDGDLKLPACFGLPSKVRLVKRSIRDYWLLRAAMEIPGGPWTKAAALRRNMRRFQASRWPFWRNSVAPAPGATRLESAMHFALRASEEMPGTAQAYYMLLRPLLSENDAQVWSDVGNISHENQANQLR